MANFKNFDLICVQACTQPLDISLHLKYKTTNVENISKRLCLDHGFVVRLVEGKEKVNENMK